MQNTIEDDINNTEDIFSWSDASTKLFLSLCKEKVHLIGRQIKNKKVFWQKIAKKMHIQGYNVTNIQVENKYKSLERSFKNMITNNKKTGRSRASCPYERELTDLLGNKHNIEPVIISGNKGASLRTERATLSALGQYWNGTSAGEDSINFHECKSTRQIKERNSAVSNMAHNVLRCAEMLDQMELFDSSDEEDLILLSPLRPILDKDDNDYNELRILHPVFGMVQRIEHVRIYNYVENIIRNYDNIDFIMHFRISRETAYHLIDQFHISEIFTSLQDDAGRSKITAEKHILSYLWFIGNESTGYRDVADRFGITISVLHTVITRVTDFIMSLAPNIIRYPTAVENEETASFYRYEKGFPGVIGAIDGSHIRIDKPTEDSESYINRKQYFSLHIQGVVNHNMKFIDVFIGYPGSVHDARVFRNSPIRNDLRELCGDNYYLLGDSAYPCLKQLIVPYKDNGHLTRPQRIFNQKLSSCRVVIENAFG